MFRAEVTVDQGGSLEGRGLRSPIPNRGKARIVPRIEGCSKIAGRPWAMLFPQLNPMRLVTVEFPDLIAGRRRHVGKRVQRGQCPTFAR